VPVRPILLYWGNNINIMKLSNIIGYKIGTSVMIVLMLVVVLSVPVTLVMAQINIGGNAITAPVSGNGKAGTLDNPLKGVSSLGDLVKTGLQVFTYIAVLIGVVMIVIVGLKYILARGKPEEMKKASQWLLYIVIGLAIVIGSRIAVSIVINTLESSGAVDPKVIQSAKNANQ